MSAPLALVNNSEIHHPTIRRDQDGAWLKDLDLAALAGLARARDIRPTIRRLVVDRGAALIGPGVAEAFGSIDQEDLDRLKRRGGPRDAEVGGPAVRAEAVLAPAGDRGRTQSVVEYQLNMPAAILVLMKLRTADAVEAQAAVISRLVGALGAAPEPPPFELPALTGRALSREIRTAVRRELDRREHRAKRAAVPLPDPTPTDRRPWIDLAEIKQAASDTAAALVAFGDLRLAADGQLVCLIDGRAEHVSVVGLRRRMDRSAVFLREIGSELCRFSAPRRLARVLYRTARSWAPPLE